MYICIKKRLCHYLHIFQPFVVHIHLQGGGKAATVIQTRRMRKSLYRGLWRAVRGWHMIRRFQSISQGRNKVIRRALANFRIDLAFSRIRGELTKPRLAIDAYGFTTCPPRHLRDNLYEWNGRHAYSCYFSPSLSSQYLHIYLIPFRGGECNRIQKQSKSIKICQNCLNYFYTTVVYFY